MVTPYHQPIEAEFIDTYAPIPFQEMMQAGMLKQAQAEQSSQLLSGFYTGLGSIKIRPENQAYFQNVWLPGIQEKTNALMKEDPTMSTPGFKMGLNKVIRETTMDEWLMRAKQEYPTWETHQGDVREYEGPTYNIYKAARSQAPTHELMEKGELYKPGRITQEANLRDRLESYIDNLISSGQTREGLDTSGMWTITENNSGRALGALGSPLGLSFKVVIDENGNQVAVLDRENSGYAPGFFGSVEHENLTNSVDQQARQLGIEEESEEWNQLFEDNYFNQALSAVYERVSKDSSVTMDANPYALIRYRQQIDDESEMRSYLSEASMRLVDNSLGLEKYSKGSDAVATFFKAVNPSGFKWIKDAIEKLKTNDITLERVFAFIDGTVIPDIPGTTAVHTIHQFAADLTKFTIMSINKSIIPDDEQKPQAYKDLEEKLSHEVEGFDNWDKKRKHRTVLNRYDKWKDEAIHIELKYETNPTIKARRSAEFLGLASDTGEITLSAITGIASSQKVYDPEKPNKEIVINDLIDKKGDQAVDYVGPVASDNPYHAGLHAIKVSEDKKAKTYYVHGSLEDEMRDTVKWYLYDYKRTPGGKGRWFEHEGVELRSTIYWDEEGNEQVGLEKRKIGSEEPGILYKLEKNDRNIIDIYNRMFIK